MILLNHSHLYYFWVVAREGSIARACQKLYLAQSTVSAQIIQLEKALGAPLFYREKKRLTLTDQGRIAFGYANQIFGLTQELVQGLQHQQTQLNLSIHLGVDAGVSKQIMIRLIETIYQYRPNAHITVQEGGWVDLEEGLQTHALDLVLTEQRGESRTPYRRSEIGQLGIIFVATPRFARHIRSFPADLSKVSLLLPTRASSIWGPVDQFLTHYKVQPHVVAEVDDIELLRLLALKGLGAAPLPDVAVAADLKAKRLVRLGQGSLGITKRLYLVSREPLTPRPFVDYLLTHFRLTRA